MTSIKISNIYPADNDLSANAENYMEDLNENELNRVVGGIGFLAAGAIIVGAGALGIGAGYALDEFID